MRRRRSGRRWLVIADAFAVLLIVATATLTIVTYMRRPVIADEVAVSRGITYHCTATAHTVGKIQTVTIDLRSPGTEVVIAGAPSRSTETSFLLAPLPILAHEHRLTAAIVAGESHSAWGEYSLPGWSAEPRRTVIRDGELLQRGEDAAILWFDEHMTGHIDETASTEWPIAARWGLGSRFIGLWDGQPIHTAGVESRRTWAGIDQSGCRLWLVHFEQARPEAAAAWMQQLGAWRAVEVSQHAWAGLYTEPTAPGIRSADPHASVPLALGVRAPRSSMKTAAR
jgi:hypothetical protein